MVIKTKKNIYKQFFLAIFTLKHYFTIMYSIVYVVGAKWHLRRKMVTPTFNYNLMQQFVKIFLEQGENMKKSLKHTESTIVEDLESFVGEFTLNIICGTVSYS